MEIFKTYSFLQVKYCHGDNIQGGEKMNIMVSGGSFDEMKKEYQEKINEDLNNSCSLKYLNNALRFYNALMTEIENLRTFFDCEIGCGVTKICIKLTDSTVFMQMVVDGCFDTVPEYMQSEIFKFLIEWCKNSIECIVKRIPVVTKQIKKDIVSSIIMLLSTVFITTFHIRITDIIVSCLNIGSEYLDTVKLVINFVFKIAGLALLIKVWITPLRWL